jgi:hypothetical protein
MVANDVDGRGRTLRAVLPDSLPVGEKVTQ